MSNKVVFHIVDEKSIKKDIIIRLLDELKGEITTDRIAEAITAELASIIINKQDKLLNPSDFNNLVAKMRAFFGGSHSSYIPRFRSYNKCGLQEAMRKEFLCNQNSRAVAESIGKIIEIADGHVIVNTKLLETYRTIAKSYSSIPLRYGENDYVRQTAYFEELGKNTSVSDSPTIWRWTPKNDKNTKLRSNWDYCFQNKCLSFDVNISDMRKPMNFYSEYRINENKQFDIARAVVNQCLEFKNKAKSGDIVIATRFNKVTQYSIYAWGIIQGEYDYNDCAEYAHSRRVEWYKLPECPLGIHGTGKSTFEVLQDNVRNKIYASILYVTNC